MTIQKRLDDLGITLPPCPAPAASYLPGVLNDGFIFVSGQTPKNGSALLFQGRLGKDLTLDQGVKAAEICVLRALSVLDTITGLEEIEQIIKITGYVNSAEDFFLQSQVIDGASNLLEKIFGPSGRHSRVAVGVNVLPGNAAVEIEMIAKVKTVRP